MKKIIILLCFCVVTQSLFAQKCLDINILSLMGQFQVPGDAATAFGSCQTTKNDEKQTVITGYGSEYDQIEKVTKDNQQAFTMASVSNTSVPGVGSAQDAQALAAKMQSMSQDERKAYAMQLASQMQSSYMQNAMAESPATAKLVMATFNIATTQLTPLQTEFMGKYRDLIVQEDQEKAAVVFPKYNSCPPVDKIGQPACGCVNALDGAYWKQIIAIVDKYNSQKAALIQSYLPRIKGMIGQIEDNIAKLHGGDDVRTANYKKMLFSSQSSAFSNGFTVLEGTIEDIQKTGSDVYVNKVNCDDLVYNLGCAHDGK
jgi:hypothetical protein